jgi:hypothetical protein
VRLPQAIESSRRIPTLWKFVITSALRDRGICSSSR